MSDAAETLRRSGELLDRAARWDALLGIGAEREAIAKAVVDERAAVVAWLHREAIRKEAGAIPWDDSELRQAADSIERGEHRREEER